MLSRDTHAAPAEKVAAGWTDRAALAIGGYGSDARVLARDERIAVAAALIDTNGDGRLVELQCAWRSEPGAAWEAGASIGAGLEGSGDDGVGYAYGRAAPGTVVEVACKGDVERLTVDESGWWLRVWPGDDEQQSAPTSRVVEDG